jgi:hypothetical protein
MKPDDYLVLDVPTIGNRKFVRSRAGRDHSSKLRRQFGQELVAINADDFEVGWSMDSDYRPPDLSDLTPRKVEEFEKYLADNEVIETANIQVKINGHISFRDGRHRVRVLLNLGMEAIPVTMTEESAEFFKQHYAPGN